MIEKAPYIEDKGSYSELQVMHSNAGYYIGTIYTDPKYGEEPGSRDSEYFKTEKDAQLFLEEIEKSNLVCIASLRDHP